MMKLVIAFGSRGLELDLPSGPQYITVQAHSGRAITNVDDALNAALDAPIGCPAFSEIAKGKRTAAISVCDITRPAPNSRTLPPLLTRLHQAGFEHKDIFICIATGLHRHATRDELVLILGAEIASQYRVVNHDAKNPEAHVFLGNTRRGTPVAIERTYLEADLHITLGFIEQHLMLGFSGGRKLIAPGLAAEATIKTIHSPRFMRESLAKEGSIENNPLHAELLEIARMVRHDFMLDVTLTRTREISGVFAGEPVAAHAAGVASLRTSSVEYLDAPVDAVITSAAGYPLDLTFYQTIKAYTAAQHILKPGGKILVLSECSEGTGSPDFSAMLRGYQGPQQYLDSIADTAVVPDQWQLEKLALVQRHNPLLLFVPGVKPEALGSLAERNYATKDEAIAELLRGLDEGARIAVIPDGPYAYARVKD